MQATSIHVERSSVTKKKRKKETIISMCSFFSQPISCVLIFIHTRHTCDCIFMNFSSVLILYQICCHDYLALCTHVLCPFMNFIDVETVFPFFFVHIIHLSFFIFAYLNDVMKKFLVFCDYLATLCTLRRRCFMNFI